MSRKPRPLAVVGLMALIGLFSAGCGSDAPSQTRTASSSRPANGSGTGAAKNASALDKAVKFAECMRSNGVPHFPDPDAKGEFNFGADVSPEVFKHAVQECKDLQPPGSLSSKRTPKQQSASLRFAACVREHGVKDFPDPANGQPVVDTTHIPSSNRPGGMTILNAAMHTCGPLLKRAAGGQG